MGYEVTVYVGEVNDAPGLDENGCQYFSIVAMMDLSKPGHKSEIGQLSQKDSDEDIVKRLQGESPFVYFFGSDGNTRIEKDRYDKRLTPFDIDDIIEALKSDSENDDYWRFDACLAMLKGLRKAGGKRGKGLKVILFGH